MSCRGGISFSGSAAAGGRWLFDAWKCTPTKTFGGRQAKLFAACEAVSGPNDAIEGDQEKRAPDVMGAMQTPGGVSAAPATLHLDTTRK